MAKKGGTLEAVRTTIEDVRASAEERYRELVTDTAVDDAVDSNDAVEVLIRAGKTFAELESDVARYRQRKAWFALLSGLDDAEHERREAAEKVAALRAEKKQRLKELEEEYDAKIKEAGTVQDAAQLRVNAANDAHSNLLRTAPKELLAESADIRTRQIPAIADRLRSAEKYVGDLLLAVSVAQRRPQDRVAQQDAAFANEQLPGARETVAALKARVEELKEQADEIDRKACFPWPDGVAEIQ